MAALAYDITFAEQGSMLQFTVIYGNETPVDLTGYSVAMQVRTQPPDDEIILDLASTGLTPRITIPTPANGRILVNVPSSVMETVEPGDYVYDMEIFTNADDHLRIISGTFSVSAEVTRSSP